ncbi:MAG: hypothetical protein ACREKH_18190 [Candidatus Rokuibacteriota bacterium]
MPDVVLFDAETRGYGDAYRNGVRGQTYDSTQHGLVDGGGFVPFFNESFASNWSVSNEYRSSVEWEDALGDPLVLCVGGAAEAVCSRINPTGFTATDRTFTGKTISRARSGLAATLHSNGSTTPHYIVCFGSSGDIEYRTRAGVWATSTGTPAQANGLYSENDNLWAVLTNGYQARKWPSGTNPLSGTAGGAIPVGDSNYAITGAGLLARSYVVFVKPDGVYVYDVDTNRFENLTPDLRNNPHPDTGLGTFTWAGEVFVPLGWGGMLRVTQSLDVLNASPLPRGARPGHTTPGRSKVNAMAGDASYLYAVLESFTQRLGTEIGLTVLTTTDDAIFNNRTSVATDGNRNTTFALADLSPAPGTIYIGATQRFAAPWFGIIQAINVSGVPLLEYFNGSAWTSAGGIDFTALLTRSGPILPETRIAADWAQTSVNGLTRFWLRAVLPTVNGTTTIAEVRALPDVVPLDGTNVSTSGYDEAGLTTHILRGYPQGGEMVWDDIISDGGQTGRADRSMGLLFSRLFSEGQGRSLIAIGPHGYTAWQLGSSGRPGEERFPDCLNGFASLLRCSADDRIATEESAPTMVKRITALKVFGRDFDAANDVLQAWVRWDGGEAIPLGSARRLPTKLDQGSVSEMARGLEYAVTVGVEDGVRGEHPPIITRIVATVEDTGLDPLEV